MMNICRVAVMLSLVGSAAIAAPPPRPQPVALAAQPGTPLDVAARDLVASDISEARKAGEQPLVLIGSAKLGGARAPSALFVQVQTPRFCGSAGCTTAVFLPKGAGWEKVLDSISGPVMVDTAQHNGMHDIVGTKNERWVWTGSQYRDSRPGPAVNLRQAPQRTTPRRS